MFKGVALGQALGESVSRAKRLMFPPLCLGCRRLADRPGGLCGRCWPKLVFLERPWCSVLGIPFAQDEPDGTISAGAMADPPPFDRARAAVLYAGLARRLAQDLKYNDRTDLAPWMAGWMARAGAEYFGSTDVVVPVPLHWGRFLSRRFNQSAELARHVARLMDAPFDPAVVTRRRRTRQQVGLSAKARQENVRGAFFVSDKSRRAIAGRRVLVVDDVLTTGATVAALARTLKRAGAVEVNVLTFARVVPGFDDEDVMR